MTLDPDLLGDVAEADIIHPPVAEADPRVTFEELGVIAPIVEALAQIGITHPFPIQSLSIPIAIQGTDMIGQARTGSGKTLAFGISLLQRVSVPGEEAYADLDAPGKPQALVMCPTRELALQVTRDIAIASTIRKARVLTVYGGVGYDTQLDTLADGVDVVVGTPGRLLDLVDRRSLDLSHVKVLVLDEADEMLDLGFLPDVERLIARTPSDRQTMLFSATMPSAIVSLARMHLSHPVNVRAEAHDAQATVPDTTQYVYQAHDLDKPQIIAKLLQSPGATRVMVFCKTKRAVQRLTDDLEERGFSATCIHGDLTQIAREKALKQFRDGKAQVIVCTDVAARGIDVAKVSHVVNYACPDDEKTYIHRIGRTARAGNTGVAITLVDWADVTRWRVINRILDLPFGEIEESYSTSPHLLADLGVPEGATGRLVAPRPRDEQDSRRDRVDRGGARNSRGDRDRGRFDRGGRDDRAGHDAGQATGDGEPAERTARPPRSRVRRRNGQVIAEAAGSTAQPAPSAAPLAAPEATDDASRQADTGDAPRKRRRRRRGGSGGDTAASSAPEA